MAWGDIRGKNRGPGNSCWDPQVKPGGARLASAHSCHSPCCELTQHKECAIKARVGAGMAQRRGSAQLGGVGGCQGLQWKVCLNCVPKNE